MNVLRDICATLSGVFEYPLHPPQGISIRVDRLLEYFVTPELKPRFEGPLRDLARNLQSRLTSELQREHADVFALRPDCSLCLAWQKYGNTPARGRALAWLCELYSETGLRLQAGRTPDSLPLVLGYLAFAPAWAVEAVCDNFLAETGELGRRLSATKSAYAAAGLCLSLLAETFPECWTYHTPQKHYDLLYPYKKRACRVC